MRENLLYLIYHGFSMIFAFATVVVLSRYFTVEDFGIYQLVLTLIAVISILKLTGIDMVLQRMIIKKNSLFYKYIQKKYYTYLIIIWLLILFVALLLPFENKYYFLATFLIFPFILIERSAPILLGLLKFKENRELVLFQSFVLFIIAICGVFFKLSIEEYISLHLVIFALIQLFKFIISSKKLNKSNLSSEVDFEVTNENKDIIKTSFVNGYLTISVYIDRLILGFLDPKLLAYLAISQILPRMIKDNIKVFLTPTYFKWVNISDKNSIEKTIHYKWHFILVGLLFYLIIAISSEKFIMIFYGESYSEAILMMQVLSIPVIFKFLESSISSSIVLIGEFDFYNKINIVFPTLKIILSICLIYFFSIWGAIVAIVSIELIKSIYLYYWVKRFSYE
jgi:O-antigen/teichoic acid export membrane protein